VRSAVTRRFARIAGSLGSVAAITIVLSRVFVVNATTVALCYLLAILVVATGWGFLEAGIASVAAMLCFNFFFLPPVGTLTVNDPQNWVALAAFLLTAAISSHLSARAQRRTIEANQRREEMEKLYALSRSLMITEGQAEVSRQVADQIAQVFGAEAVAVFDRSAGKASRSGPQDLPVSDSRLQDVALQGTEFRDAETGVTLIPVSLGGRTEGSVGIQGASISETALYAVANLAAIAFERARSRALLGQAEAARQNQELKSALLDAIAHEFKTPLTSIKAAVTALLSYAPADANSKELLTVMDEESDRLNYLVTEAIGMARIEAGEIRVRREAHLLADLVAASLKKLRPVMSERRVAVAIPANLPPCCADPDLIEMVVTQLLGNAAKYSDPDAPIQLAAQANGDHVVVSVVDQGPGIPKKDLERVFEKFYRSPEISEHIPGTGMGLAIARQIVEAHRGKIWVESAPGRGSKFCFTLPIAAAEACRE
jgi:two-component system, OmpR family, sensor histidine kinase KdpD